MTDKPTRLDMSTEPALSIGAIFANKVMIQPVVAAFVAIIAGILNTTVDSGMVDNITLLITFGAIVWSAWSAQIGQKKLATEQAEATRSAVYSPATTQRIVDRAAQTGDTSIDPPPADRILSKL